METEESLGSSSSPMVEAVPAVATARPLLHSSQSHRRISANHLLNFTLPHRPAMTAATSLHGNSTTSHSHSSHGHRRAVHAVFRRDQFVNANYRFVLSFLSPSPADGADPNHQQWKQRASSDPIVGMNGDVPWDQVELAIIVAPKIAACPICLETPPLVPRLAKCGHVFCYPCVLHYLQLTEKRWRRCPICFDAIYAADLKSVAFRVVPDYRRLIAIGGGGSGGGAGSEMGARSSSDESHSDTLLRMKLMKKHPADINSLPSHVWSFAETRNGKLARSKDMRQEQETFYRVMVADEAYMRDHVFAKEEQQVMEALDYAKTDPFADPSELPYLEMALHAVRERSREFEQFMMTAKLSPGRSAVHSNTPFSPSPTEYHYYQVADGQHVYLHPLDIRILKSVYGDYARFPPEISVPISALEEHFMTEELQRRCKYLSHVPLSCSIAFCEIDWMGAEKPLKLLPPLLLEDTSTTTTVIYEPLVPNDALQPWKTELRNRSQKRAAKQKKDDQHAQAPRKSSMTDDPILEAMYAPPPRTWTPTELDFANEETWHRLPSNSNSSTGTGVPVVPAPGSASSFARVTGKTVDELLHEKLHLQQVGEEGSTSGGGRRRKKKGIVLMSSSHGGRRGYT